MSDAFGRPSEPRHRALDDVQRASDSARIEQSMAWEEAAGNLLEKAYHALRTGDQHTARTYLRRAAALPWDEHKETCPAAWEVHQLLFEEVVEALQDEEWLDTVTEVIEGLDDEAAQELRQILEVIGHDYQVSGTERRVIRSLAGDRTTYPSDPTFGLTASSSVDEVVAVLEPMLRALIAYTDALDRAG